MAASGTLGLMPHNASRRASQVRVLPGAPFPKEFADYHREQRYSANTNRISDQSRDFAPHPAHSFPEELCELESSPSASRSMTPLDLQSITRCSLGNLTRGWHRVLANELKSLRHAVALSQHRFASLLGVSVNTFRMWDSGLRPPRPEVRQQFVLAQRDRLVILRG